MATLIEIVNSVFTETGYPELSSIVGNTTNAARRILGLANLEGKALSKKDWTILLKRNVITTFANAESYALPTDFDRFIDNTHWDLSTYQPMDGPIATQVWQGNKSGQVSVTVNDRWQVRADGNANRIFIDPIPTSAEQLSFYYASNAWCRSHGGARQSYFKADNDVLLLDDFVYTRGLVCRWLKANRRPYEEDYAEYLRERDKAFARDGGMPMLTITEPSDWRPYANVGETGFGS